MKRPTLLRSIIATVLLFLAPQLAIATTRTVTNLNDSGAGSLRDTIAASASSDTINFAVTGTIVLTSSSLYVNHNLTIQGPGADSLTIARQSTSNFRIFYFDNGTWTLSDVTISNGLDGVTSGGIYNGNGNLTVNNCIIANNIAGSKAGGIGNNATTTLNNCTLINNKSGTGGGGAIFSSGSSLTMNNCTIGNNTAQGEGGGIYNFTGTVTISNSTFNDNTGVTGGGIYFEFGSSSTIRNCTFSNNHGSGNAIKLGSGAITVQSCTFSGNVSGAHGTIYMNQSASTLNIGNTIIQGSGGNISNAGGTVTSQGYNLTNDDGGGFLTAVGDQINTDPKLDPFGLQANGGPTKTIALTYGSPAIDAGKSFGLTTDQTGNARTYDNRNLPNAVGGDGTDIGAYEVQTDDSLEAGLIVNTTGDHDDGVCGADCTLREAIARAQTLVTSSPPTITFASNVTGTITLGGDQFDSLFVEQSANIIINGPGARVLAISGNDTHRIFTIDSPATLSVSGLTIRDGKYDPSTDTTGELHSAGAVYNFGHATFTDCAFVNNSVTGASNTFNGGFGGSGQGGAIYNHGGYLTFNRCTFSGNSATGAAGNTFSSGNIIGPGGNGGAGQGGAVFNNGTLSVTNCTFNGNRATGGNGGPGNSGFVGASGGNANGGAVCNLGTMNIISATVSGNTGTGGAGAAFGFRHHGPNGSGNGGLSAQSGSSDRVANTLCAANSGTTAPDAEGIFSSDGNNLIGIGDQSSGWRTDLFFSDQVGTTAAAINPQLGSLQNNGGPTDTMAPLTGSPAIDQGYSSGLSTDQRGYQRPFDDPYVSNASDGSDIGAFELNLVLPTSVVSGKNHGTAGSFSITLPLSGSSGIECRSGDVTGDHQLIVTFPSAVTINGSPQAQVTTGTGQIGTGGTSNGGVVSLDQTKTIVTVPLTSVANAQRIVVTLFSVSDGVNTNNVTIPMGVLLGDTTANGAVNSSDIAQTQSQSGQPVNSSNFREDVTANGSINSSDIALVQSKSGTALPAGVSQSPAATTTAPQHRGSPEKSF